MSLKTDPDQQAIHLFLPREDAQRLLARANSFGWSRAELLRRLIRAYLGSIR